MAREVTIAALEQKVRWQADQERATLRHTSVALREAINDSIQDYREMITEHGHSYFLTHKAGRTSVGATADENDPEHEFAWGLIETSSFQPPVVRVEGIDIHHNGVEEEMTAVSFSERNYYSRQGGGYNHIPQNFFMYDETKIGITPAPDSEYRYTIWYLPQLPELMADNDVFNPAVPGGDKWVIWDVIVALLIRDNYPDLLQAAMAERSRCEVDVLHKAGQLQRANPYKRLNTRDRARTRIRRLYFAGSID